MISMPSISKVSKTYQLLYTAYCMSAESQTERNEFDINNLFPGEMKTIQSRQIIHVHSRLRIYCPRVDLAQWSMPANGFHEQSIGEKIHYICTSEMWRKSSDRSVLGANFVCWRVNFNQSHHELRCPNGQSRNSTRTYERKLINTAMQIWIKCIAVGEKQHAGEVMFL